MTRTRIPNTVATTGPRMLTISIEGIPPSNNHAYKQTTMRTKTGKVYAGRRLTADAEAWRTSTALHVKMTKNRVGFDVTRRTRLAVEITYGLHALYVKDLDNLLKIVIDALASGLEWDDRYLVDLTVRKRRAADEETLITVVKLDIME